MKFFAILLFVTSAVAFGKPEQPFEIRTPIQEPARVLCTMQYDPVVCSFEDISASGSNRCFARASLNAYAAAHGIEIDPEKVVCSAF